MLNRDQFLRRVESFLKKTGMRATAFGREAMGDTAFVSRLRTGDRETREATQNRALAFMDSYGCSQASKGSKAKKRRKPKRASTRKT